MIQAMVDTFLRFYNDTDKSLIVVIGADLSDNIVYEGLKIVLVLNSEKAKPAQL